MIRASAFTIRSHSDAEEARLGLSGELDIATAPQLEQAVGAALDAGARHVVIDLGGLSFVDSSGLRLFIIFADRARSEGWTLALVRPPEPSLSVFRLTGAEENLPFVEDPDGR
jgi:anti-sigma B factor antagonist